MKKTILHLGESLQREAQKQIKGGNRYYGNDCNAYNGPTFYGRGDCDVFNSLPFEHQICVDVHPSCLQ